MLAATAALCSSVLLVACAGSTGSPATSTDRDGGATSAGDGGSLTGDGGSPAGDASVNVCQPGAYTETLPTPTASIADLVSSYAPPAYQDFVLKILERRYPLGKSLVTRGLANTEQGNCIERFTSDRSNAAAILRRLEVVVHECGHIADFALSKSLGTNGYFIRDDLTFSCKSGDTTTRGGVTFARSRIRGDAYNASRPPCGGTVTKGCDSYANVYLDGNPDDAKFESGDQGYNLLLEEAVQYVNSLATGYAFEDQLKTTIVSNRDGILTLLWYLERYIKLARETYPAAYKLISEDPCWRHGTLTVWARAQFYLEKTKGSTSLGIDDEAIEALVNAPELLKEIETLRQLDCK